MSQESEFGAARVALLASEWFKDGSIGVGFELGEIADRGAGGIQIVSILGRFGIVFWPGMTVSELIEVLDRAKKALETSKIVGPDEMLTGKEIGRDVRGDAAQNEWALTTKNEPYQDALDELHALRTMDAMRARMSHEPPTEEGYYYAQAPMRPGQIHKMDVEIVSLSNHVGRLDCWFTGSECEDPVEELFEQGWRFGEEPIYVPKELDEGP